jgi:hypothetical protein
MRRYKDTQQSSNGAAQQCPARQGWDYGHQTKIER